MPYENGTELVFGSSRVILSLILKLEEVLKVAAQVQFFEESSLSCRLIGLPPARVATTGIGPILGPQRFFGATVFPGL